MDRQMCASKTKNWKLSRNVWERLDKPVTASDTDGSYTHEPGRGIKWLIRSSLSVRSPSFRDVFTLSVLYNDEWGWEHVWTWFLFKAKTFKQIMDWKELWVSECPSYFVSGFLNRGEKGEFTLTFGCKITHAAPSQRSLDVMWFEFLLNITVTLLTSWWLWCVNVKDKSQKCSHWTCR